VVQTTELCFQYVGFRLLQLHNTAFPVYRELTEVETLRIGNIVPLSVPHGTSEDVQFKGYTIPRNTVVIANLDSVLSDENIFLDPYITHIRSFSSVYVICVCLCVVSNTHVIILFFFVLCTLCCQFLWIVLF
jgi:hypothetical protein